ncbi:MAG: ribonuclease III [Aestuariivita sp.]|nr:ribonuclease III [Aestuariivita sp.]MCY4201207.1 ribonuclease III [Aestuariivita sp.]MCY4288985.1 ribonuclease III [Aestuariivita sp.]MCY4346574.1 ribonuclease III [Aestuariivita sp.]
MTGEDKLKAFEARIGHKFRTPALLERAVVHSSKKSVDRENNQQLEFLGDRVLGLIIAEALLEVDPDVAVGDLAPRYNSLIRNKMCAEIARSINLGEILSLGRTEMLSGGRRKDALLGDALEAVIAAIYHDAGLNKVRKVVRHLWGERIRDVAIDARDSKSLLQQWAQARSMMPPSYTVISQEGPDHAPTFSVFVNLQDGQSAQAKASSKRQAEQAAAELLMSTLVDKSA